MLSALAKSHNAQYNACLIGAPLGSWHTVAQVM